MPTSRRAVIPSLLSEEGKFAEGARARVARLRVHPVKSLDGQDVETADVLPSGALRHDRAYAFFDVDGAVVNAKRFPALQRLRARADLAAERLELGDADGREWFDCTGDRVRLEGWVSERLGFAVTCREDRRTGFPDDLAAPGPTVVSTATLAAIAAWFGLTLDDVRARLRANVEIDGVPPFWEDRLFGAAETTVAFGIGAVRFLGTNPCLRCAVPTRDPWTGVADKTFAKRFAAQRRIALPPWAVRERFDTFYRVTVNTRAMEESGGCIRVGDALEAAPAG